MSHVIPVMSHVMSQIMCCLSQHVMSHVTSRHVCHVTCHMTCHIWHVTLVPGTWAYLGNLRNIDCGDLVQGVHLYCIIFLMSCVTPHVMSHAMSHDIGADNNLCII